VIRCGVDLLAIERVREGIDRLGERYLARFFTPAERADCQDKPHRLAARIAAKEAVSKVFGTGIGDIGWKDIEITSDLRGRPVLTLHGKAAELAAALGLTEWDISLSHTDETAMAMAVATGTPPRKDTP
jgi:holo-[acyl-carrier protein] synthase